MELRGLALLAVIAAAMARPDATPPPVGAILTDTNLNKTGAALPAAPSAPITGNLCSFICDCAGEVIKCICKNNEKVIVKEDAIENQTEAKSFEVNDCSSLVFDAGNFKNTPNVKKLIVTNVADVDIQKVPINLENLMVNKVPGLKFRENVFVGVSGLNSINIAHSTIPKLSQGELHFSPGKKVIELNDVTIKNVEKNALKIEELNEGSSVKISNCIIENVDEEGLKITTPNISLKSSTIKNAKENSVNLNGQKSLEIEGNTFQSDVHLKSIKFECPIPIKFTKNKLYNIDTSNLGKYTLTGVTSYTLDMLTSSQIDNNVNCKCGDVSKLDAQMLKNIFCVDSCKAASLEAFIHKCPKTGGSIGTVNSKDIVKEICDIPKSSTEQVGPTKPGITTVASTLTETHIPGHEESLSHASKNSVYFLPLLAVYFFHLLL